MVGATAQGVRLTQSKLRYHAQDYSHGVFSFVRGKEVWRMTGAKEIEGKGEMVDTDNRKLYIRILILLNRLLPGEEKNEKLFEIVERLYNFLVGDVNSRELVEYVTVLRILYSLGYIYNKDTFKNLLEKCDLNEDVFKEVEVLRKEIIKEINEGLRESQL